MERVLLFVCRMEDMSSTRPVTGIEKYRKLRRQTVSAAFVARQRKNALAHQPKRALPRAELSLPLTLHLDEWEIDTWTANLSAAGLGYIANTAPTEEDFRFQLEIRPGVLLRGWARVVGVVPRGAQFYISLRFFGISDRARILLEELVIDTLLAHDFTT